MQSVEEPTRDIYGAQGRDPWPGAGCKEGTALMEVLLVTNLWPRGGTHTFTGVFVREQVKAICRAYPDIHYDLLVIRGQENKLNYLIAPFRVYNAMRRKKYDLLHAHYGLSAVGAVFRGRTPLLVTLHGSDVMSPGFPARLSKWGTLRWADGIIVVSAEMKQLLGREDAAVVPMGYKRQVQTHGSNPGKESDWPSRGTSICVVRQRSSAFTEALRSFSGSNGPIAGKRPIRGAIRAL